SQERAGLWDGLAVLTASMVLAWALTRAVDAPVRRSEWLEARPWRALTAVAASVAVVVAASGGWWLALPGSEARTPVASTEPVVPTDEVATEAPLTVRPQGWQLGTQWPNLPESCEGPWAPSSSFHNITCQQLLPGDATASETIVVLGSSHSRQYIPALIPLARERGAQIVNLSMDGCEFVIREDDSGYCGGYDRYALSYLDQVEPDAVLMTATLPGLPRGGHAGRHRGGGRRVAGARDRRDRHPRQPALAGGSLRVRRGGDRRRGHPGGGRRSLRRRPRGQARRPEPRRAAGRSRPLRRPRGRPGDGGGPLGADLP